MTDLIKNDTNQVAIRYHQPAQVLSKNTPSGKQYFFDVKAGVSMAWVDETDVSDILTRRGGCCNSKRQLYDYANQAAVDLWSR